MSENPSVRTSRHEVRLEGDLGPFDASLERSELSPGVEAVTLRLSAARPAAPPRLVLAWHQPVVDIHGVWHPKAQRNRSLGTAWDTSTQSRGTSGAPVVCLYSQTGRSRLTFACSEALEPVGYFAGVIEETAEFRCAVTFFAEPRAPLTSYEATVRLDSRDVPYHEALADVSAWWASLPGFEPALFPEAARMPMYSTWYGFHQVLELLFRLKIVLRNW